MPPMPHVAPDALHAVVALIRQYLPDVEAIHLFGSATGPAMRADSDVDLAVLGPHPVPAELRGDLEYRCAGVLRAEADLVDLRVAPLALQAAILAEGQLLYAAHPGELAFFENMILSRYCAFNEERRPFFDVVLSRGSIHA